MQASNVSIGQTSLDPMVAMPDDDLVSLAKAGEQSAYVELFRRHSKMAMRMINRILKNTEDSEDVLQESILKAYIHLHGFDGRSKFSTWFARISVNTALMNLRQRKSRIIQSLDDFHEVPGDYRIELLEQADDPESSVVKAQLAAQLRLAIRHLPPGLRVVTEIRQSTDLSILEVAELAGLTVAATKARLRRARKELTFRMNDRPSCCDHGSIHPSKRCKSLRAAASHWPAAVRSVEGGQTVNGEPERVPLRRRAQSTVAFVVVDESILVDESLGVPKVAEALGTHAKNKYARISPQ